ELGLLWGDQTPHRREIERPGQSESQPRIGEMTHLEGRSHGLTGHAADQVRAGERIGKEAQAKGQALDTGWRTRVAKGPVLDFQRTRHHRPVLGIEGAADQEIEVEPPTTLDALDR